MVDVPSIPADFTALADIDNWVGKIINVIGIVVDYREPMLSRHGDQDWTTTIQLCDKSRSLLANAVQVRMFVKDRAQLPTFRNESDKYVIILQGVKVSNYNGQRVLLSNRHTFKWLLHTLPAKSGSNPLISRNGPAFLATEPILRSHIDYVNRLRSWWTIRGGNGTASGNSNIYLQQVAKKDGRRRYALIRDMEIGKFYDVVGEVVKTFADHMCFTVYITDYTENSRLYNWEWGKVNGQYSEGTKWTGPWGCYSLQVSLWVGQASAARSQIREGQYLTLINMRAKENKDHALEGALHDDRRYSDKVLFAVIKDENDPRIIQIKQRKKEYLRRFNTTKPRLEEERELVLTQRRNEEYERPTPKVKKEKFTPTETYQLGPLQSVTNSTKTDGNPSIRYVTHTEEVTPIGEIYKRAQGEGQEFFNSKYLVKCRVVDFRPEKLENFAVLQDPDESSSESEEDFDLDDATGQEKQKWIWRFALLVEGTDGEKLQVIVTGREAQYLLNTNVEPADLHGTRSKIVVQTLGKRLRSLWGNLADYKNAQRSGSNKKDGKRKKNHHSGPSKKKYNKHGNSRPDPSPPFDSDSDEEITLKNEYFYANIMEYAVELDIDGKTFNQRTWRIFDTAIST